MTPTKNTHEIYARSEGIKNKIVRPFLMLMGRQDIVQLFTQKGLIVDANNIKRWEESLNFQFKAGAKLPAGYMEHTSNLSNSIQSIAISLGLGIDMRRASAYTPRYRLDGDVHQTDFVNIMHMILDIERHGEWLMKQLANPAALFQAQNTKYILQITHTSRTKYDMVSKYTYQTECDTFQHARTDGHGFILTTVLDAGGLLNKYMSSMTEAPKIGESVTMEHEMQNDSWKERYTTARIMAVPAVSDNAKKFK